MTKPRPRSRRKRKQTPWQTVVSRVKGLGSDANGWIRSLPSPTRQQLEFGAVALLAVALAITGIVIRATRETGTKRLVLERVSTLREPVDIAQPPGRGELVVVERAGRLEILGRPGEPNRTLLDIRRAVKKTGAGGEQGMLSVAFPADFASSRRYYVTYTDRRDDLRLVEYRVRDTDQLLTARGSRREILTVPQPTTQHHSGHLEFGPDGFLYLGSGDGGPSGDPRNVSRDPRSLLGKILRIDPSKSSGRRGAGNRRPYRVPASNPYVRGPGRNEVFAVGLRNPWSFSFDRSTGALVVSDVGNSRIEEVNYLPAGKGLGADFGWPAYEGPAPFKGGVPRSRTVAPAAAYPHGPACSVIGSEVVRDPRLSRVAGPEVVGAVVFGDFCTGRVYAFFPDFGPAKKIRKLRFRIRALSAMGSDLSGRVYLLSLDGGIWRLSAERRG